MDKVIFAELPKKVEWVFTNDNAIIINTEYAETYAREYPEEYKRYQNSISPAAEAQHYDQEFAETAAVEV